MKIRGTSNANARGSVYDRAARRKWMIEQFGSSSGKTISCHHCGRRMLADRSRWEVDRFPVCGHHGGRYVRGNIVPSCPRCNKRRCVPRCRGGRGTR